MVILSEATAFSRSNVAEFASFAAAEAHVRATYRVAFFEVDEDYVDCADVLLEDGRVLAIQPATLVKAA